MKLSIIIPVYCGGYILTELTGKIRSTLTDLYDFELIFICDKCDDLSQNIVKQLTHDDPGHIKAFFFKKNYGQHKALQYGLGQAQGDFFVTMDEDLQHDPAFILQMLEKQQEGNYDLVYGRYTDPQHGGIRNRISILLRKVLKHYIPSLYDNYSPFRLIKKEIAVRTSIIVAPYIFIDDLLSRLTKNITFINIRHHRRNSGASSYTFLKLIKHGIFILFAYSRILTRCITFGGSALILGSVMLIIKRYLSWEIIHNLETTRLISVIIITGLISMVIGLAGVYVNFRNNQKNAGPLSLSFNDTL